MQQKNSTNSNFIETKSAKSGDLPERLQTEIERLGISMHRLSQIAGISHTSINRYLEGAEPKLATAKKLANALNVDVQWLLTGEIPVATDDVVTIEENSEIDPELLEDLLNHITEDSVLTVIQSLSNDMLRGDAAAGKRLLGLIERLQTNRPDLIPKKHRQANQWDYAIIPDRGDMPDVSVDVMARDSVPVMGAVSAGTPTFGMYDYPQELVKVPGKNWSRDHHFVVKVVGNSMEPEIPDGWFVVCRRLEFGQFALKGQIVIACDVDTAYIKKLIYSKSGPKSDTPRKVKPHLVSINPDYPEVTPVTEDLMIRGVVEAKVQPDRVQTVDWE